MVTLKSLNDKQKKAVLWTDGPILIIAGAGSGKTRVLTHRIAYLIKEKNISPNQILAVTFTNKAANELKHRIRKMVGVSSKDMWIGTFHAICGRILRKDIDKLGWDNNFVIYDADDQKSIIKEVIRRLNLDFQPGSVLNAISKAKENLISVEEYKKIISSYFEEQVGTCYELYQKLLKENNALDFDDMIMYSIELLTKNDSVRSWYQKKFKYINIDEYQDVNHAQYVLSFLLSQYHKNICVIGDDDQSIYGFRGADIKNILHFEKNFKNTKVFKLEENYRSTQIILDAANNVIANNVGRKSKRLWTKNPKGEKIICYQANDEEDEAQFVANEIKRLSKDYSLNDIAILYRINAQSRVLEEKLLYLGVPYKIFSGVKFYERKEIKDLLSLLKILVNPQDKINMLRAINFMTQGIGKTTLNKAIELASLRKVTFLEVLQDRNLIKLSEYQSKNLSEFISIIKELQKLSKELSAFQITEKAIEFSDILKKFEKEGTEESLIRAENIKEFLSVAREFEKHNEDTSISAFLTQISLMTDQDLVDESKQFVSLMTIHSVKGLEFPVVFIVGLDEGLFPHYKSLNDSFNLEEERRLCYVAITRAKEKLYLLHTDQRIIFGDSWSCEPSRFLEEIPSELIDNLESNGSYKSNNEEHLNLQSKNSKFSVGSYVKHPAFGIGQITGIENSDSDIFLEILFNGNDKRTLSAKYAQLTTIK